VNAEGRERFFRAIAERIDVERVDEVHVFPAIRQGGRESGVAVLTMRPLPAEGEVAESPPAEPVVEEAAVEDSVVEDSANEDSGLDVSAIEGPAMDGPAIDELPADELPVEESSSEESPAARVPTVDAPLPAEVSAVELPSAEPSADEPQGVEPPQARAHRAPPRRFTVLRAHYRLQLKGPDRGKWEVGVVEEADAPSATVDEVVRGVHERAGGWSVEGPERLTGDEFRAALVDEPWSATR
jgi:hypothetical protein